MKETVERANEIRWPDDRPTPVRGSAGPHGRRTTLQGRLGCRLDLMETPQVREHPFNRPARGSHPRRQRSRIRRCTTRHRRPTQRNTPAHPSALESQETSEARRVLYVGASRARRLLVLAVPPKHLDALREILQNLDPHIAYLVDD